jgi:hypothetical protein
MFAARVTSSLGMLLFLVGCEGGLDLGGDVSVPDMTTTTDMGPAGDSGGGSDMTPTVDPLCVGVTCPTNSICSAGLCYCAPGYMGNANLGCMPGNPCQGVMCPFGATCDDNGECPCDPGFDDDGLGGCSFADPMFPDQRTQQEVCARWTSDYPETAPQQWQTEPADACAPGELDPAFHVDALRRVTLFRWLSGLPGVTSNVEYSEWTQACASLLAAEDKGVTLVPDASQACFSEDAQTGLSASNLLRGATSAAESVDIFMVDDGVPDLSHRRWILNPGLGASAFGFRGRYTCMYALDQSGSASPQFVAFPTGVFPQQALRGPWTFGSEQLGLENASVSITDGSGANVPAAGLYVAEGNFGLETMAWTVEGATAPATYNITVSGLTGPETEVSYTVELVDCP